MKKLMIAAAIVCAAAMSQAATVNWSTDWLIASNGEYIMDQTADWTYAATITFSPSGSASLSMADGQWSGSGSDFTEATDYTATLVITEYNKGVATATLTGTGAFTTAGEQFPTEIDFSSGTGFKSGTYFGTGEGQWQSVPEPTSGLLLLLGVAGLALKRKRA